VESTTIPVGLRIALRFYKWSDITQENIMKKMCAFAGRTVLVASMSLACALPAFAQNTGAADSANTANTGTTTQTTQPRQEEHHDYGWIGLLGLAGLLGLRRKHEDHRHTNTTTTHQR
jgi:MYXO-CTERM domain-containing protein